MAESPWRTDEEPCPAALQEIRMSTRHLPAIVFLILVASVAGGITMMWPHLPDRLATHFNAAGEPNGWSSKDQLLRLLLTQLAPFLVMFVAAGWLRRLPDRFVNLPNKDYWLAPVRKENTLVAIRDWTRWFLIVVFAVLAFMVVEMLRDNLMPSPHYSLLPPWLIVPLILAPIFGMIGWLFRRFRIPPASPS
jgi:uncharacterized membrane protein